MKSLQKKRLFPVGFPDVFGAPRSPTLADPFENFFNMTFDNMFGSTDTVRANVVSVPGGLEIQVEAPGLNREDFKISKKGNVLTISSHVEKKKEDVYSREFYRSSFSRSWTLPEDVREGDIGASYEQGILRVSIPYEEPKSEPEDEVVIDIK